MMRRLHRLLALGSTLFPPTSALSARLRAAGVIPSFTPTRLLNYDIVLNVKLVVHVNDVDLNALSVLLTCSLRRRNLALILLLLPLPFHVGWDDPLNVEELLLIGRG